MRLIITICAVVLTGLAAHAQTYPVSWVDVANVTVNGDNSLTKPAGSTDWNAGAVGLNVLDGGVNGYVQFTVSGTGNNYMVSLSTLNNDLYFNTLGYVISIPSTNTITVREGATSRGTFGTAVTGDVFRISREGTAVKYYKNGTVFYTSPVTVDASLRLRPDVAISINTCPPVIASFDKKLCLVPQFQFPGYANNNGSITMQVRGAYAPVTYAWSSGETTASISNKPRGTYTVTATDAQARSVTATYYLGYAIEWANLGNVSVNANNSLTKIGTTTGYDAGASSVNMLLPNTDGFLEFTITEPAATYINIGISRLDADLSNTAINCRWLLGPNGLYTIMEGSSLIGNFGGMMYGDVVRISREAANLNYYVNGTLQRTVASSAGFSILVDVSLQTNAGATPVITTSFDKPIRLKPAIVNPGSANNNGAIALTVLGTYPPAAVTWSSSETVAAISGKVRGSYTATVTDALSGHTSTRTYQLGYRVLWNNVFRATLEANGAISKTGTTTTADAGGVSSNQLAASTDGWVEFVTDKPGQRYNIGLSRFQSAPLLSGFDYAIAVTPGGNVDIMEGSANRGTFANFEEGDVYKISREGALIKYYRNGTLLRSVATTLTYVLYADILLYTGSAPLTTASFNRTAQTYYSIANGNWNAAATWSLTDGGAATTTIPGEDDDVVIKGFTVDVTTTVSCRQLSIAVTNAGTALRVDGPLAVVRCISPATVQGTGNAQVTRALLVQNNGKFSVLNP